MHSQGNGPVLIEEIIKFAVEKEQEAYEFYIDWAKKLEHREIREVFGEFAEEEIKHKNKLLNLNLNESFQAKDREIEDLKIADYLVDVNPSEDINYQDALIIAMKREKESFHLYSDLAKITTDEKTKNLFLMLAQEEAAHKLKIETLYDQYVLIEG